MTCLDAMPAVPLRADQQAAILAVNEAAVQVVSRDRSLPRKELAALVRKLFKQLGIKGVSVTAPSYSMAMSIDNSLRKRAGYAWIDAPNYEVDPKCEARVNNNRVIALIGEILARAFPQHDDRGNSQTDHFDFKLSIR